MTPENGAGTSTIALAVSTASMGSSTLMWSPALTCQRTISASASPSPRSGRLKVFMEQGLFGKCCAHGVGNSGGAGDVVVFEARKWNDGVVTGDPLDGGVQVVEAVLGHGGSDFRAYAAVSRGFVNDYEPTGLCHGLEDSIVVNR